MTTSQKGIDLIKEFEGFSDTAYLCSAGVLTIGYGSTRINGELIRKGQKISRSEAEAQLRLDLERFENAIMKYVKVPLYQEHFDALVVFTYNVGEGALKNSTLLKKLNNADYKGAEQEFLKWNKANGKELAGLTRRRKAEADLFALGTLKHKETVEYLASVKPRGLDDKT